MVLLPLQGLQEEEENMKDHLINAVAEDQVATVKDASRENLQLAEANSCHSQDAFFEELLLLPPPVARRR